MIPILSVVIPVYNVEEYLEKCLSSVAKQSFWNFEAIIVNDGSQDDSSRIAEEFAKRDDRFKVINQNNRGLGGARNTGISNAEGKYLFLLDSDDYLKPDCFKDLVQYSEDNDLDVLVFNYDRVDEDGNLISVTNFGEGTISKDEALRRILSLNTSPQAWNKLYKTELFKKGAIAYPENCLHEDIPVTYRLFWSAYKVGYHSGSYYCWLVRGGSITQNFGYKHIDDVFISLLSIKQYLEDKNIFTAYETEYVEGCVKMYRLLLERSLEHGLLGCMDYLQYLIDKRAIVSDEQFQLLEKANGKLLIRYQTTYNIVKKRSTQFLARYQKKIQTRRDYVLSLKKNPLIQVGFSFLLKVCNFILPLGTRRRSCFKKMIGR